MRNRVAHEGARVTLTSVMRGVRVTALLTAALLVAGAQVASADTVVADERFSTGVGGLVGILAVILGIGGLAAGLVRRRKLSAARATLVATPQPKPEPARSDTAA